MPTELISAEDLIHEIQELKQKVAFHDLVWRSGSIRRADRKQEVLRLLESNQELTRSAISTHLKIRHIGYVLELMHEVADENDLEFIKGAPGQESMICKKLENKLLHAVAEIERYFVGKPLYTKMRLSAVARAFNLNGQETESVVVHLCRHSPFRVFGKPRDEDRRLVKCR